MKKYRKKLIREKAVIAIYQKLLIDITKEEMEKQALNIENVKNHIEGKEIVKVIIIPKKLVNIVVK